MILKKIFCPRENRIYEVQERKRSLLFFFFLINDYLAYICQAVYQAESVGKGI